MEIFSHAKAYLRNRDAGASPELAEGRSEESLPRYRQMPRTLLRYAIEKFPESERQLYLKGEVSP